MRLHVLHVLHVSHVAVEEQNIFRDATITARVAPMNPLPFEP